MSGYTDSEKVQYALKTALSRTMQTAMSDSAGAEKSAPLRIFPSNIMKVDIIEKGKGDIGSDGNYVTGHKDAGTAADMINPEDTVKNYKIICPVNNVVTSITISSLVSYGSSTLSFINGRSTSGTNYPLKQWFYRGHLSGSGESAFGAANTNYHGLQLAWNSATNGATAANGIPSSPLNISASKTIEPVAKITRMNVPINSTVKICKFEYVIIFHHLLI